MRKLEFPTVVIPVRPHWVVQYAALAPAKTRIPVQNFGYMFKSKECTELKKGGPKCEITLYVRCGNDACIIRGVRYLLYVILLLVAVTN